MFRNLLDRARHRIAQVTANDRVARCWGDTARQRERTSLMGWLDSPLVLELYVQPTITPEGGNWLVGVAHQEEIPANSRWLSLGCGSGGQEIYAAQMGLFAEMDAYDLAEGAIEVATDNAARQGCSKINFRVGDFNTVSLAPERYDVVLMNMSLHHVAELEKLYEQIRATLNPDGWFIANEYIGPSQMQYTAQQLAMVNRLLSLLPDELCYDYVRRQTKTEYIIRSRAEWDAADPSEAVRSDEIVPVAQSYFSRFKRIDYGGTLLAPLLEHIIGNFAADNEPHVAILKLLIFYEKKLIAEGILPSDFAVLVARK